MFLSEGLALGTHDADVFIIDVRPIFFNGMPKVFKCFAMGTPG